MLDNGHAAFSPPPDSTTIWRFMRFAKLLSLLENRQLYVPRADQLQDPYEGVLPRATVQKYRDLLKPAHNSDAFFAGTAAMRQQTFVSCWFANEHESAAMWSAYCLTDDGVAIKTTHRALAKALDASPLAIRTSRVQYVDYETDEIPAGNGFYSFLHKRLSFMHEQEVRAVVWADEGTNRPLIKPDALDIKIDVDPSDLIASIHVSPTAPSWFGELVEQVIRRYLAKTPVIKSGLYDRPTY